MSARFVGIALAAIGAVTISSLNASAGEWPDRPLTMVVPFAAGSASDTVGRIVAAGLSGPLGQQVVIENIGGAGGMTGSVRVAKAAPDGYQFVLASVDTIAINQSAYKKPLYNSKTDFTPLGLIVEQPIVLLARADLPANTLQEFVAYTKANGAKMQFGSGGVGSGSHLACARINAAIGAETTHIPYRGSAQALQDLAAGRIDYYCSLGAAVVAPLEAKTAKAIANLARERSPLFPDIPSSVEQGLPGVEAYFWSGFFFPKDTPAPIVAKMHEAMQKTLNDTATQERLKKTGVSVVSADRRSADYLRTFVDEEIAAWAATIKASGVALD
jgi:tripartite-type tricarboxylate transporter receptor subunit TctC